MKQDRALQSPLSLYSHASWTHFPILRKAISIARCSGGEALGHCWSRILSFEDLRILGGLGNHLKNSQAPLGSFLSLACSALERVRSSFSAVLQPPPFLQMLFMVDLVNRLDAEASLCQLHALPAERGGRSALGSHAHQQTLESTAGHLSWLMAPVRKQQFCNYKLAAGKWGRWRFPFPLC